MWVNRATGDLREQREPPDSFEAKEPAQGSAVSYRSVWCLFSFYPAKEPDNILTFTRKDTEDSNGQRERTVTLHGLGKTSKIAQLPVALPVMRRIQDGCSFNPHWPTLASTRQNTNGLITAYGQTNAINARQCWLCSTTFQPLINTRSQG